MFDGKIYEKFDIESPIIPWSCEEKDFTKSTIIYTFFGKEFSDAYIVTDIGNEWNTSFSKCISVKNFTKDIFFR